MENIYENTWASLVVWIKKIRDELQQRDPLHPLMFYDWEAHANQLELPNSDLIGVSTLAIREYDEGLFSIAFAVGIGTYGNDTPLARQRSMINFVYNRMLSGHKIPYYDYNSADVDSVIQMVPGTLIAPMDNMTVRPYQYVQGSALLIPAGQDA